MRIDLTQRALRQLAGVNERFGATHLTVQSRLVEWFAKQDMPTQWDILQWDSDKPDSKIGERILRKMAARK